MDWKVKVGALIVAVMGLGWFLVGGYVWEWVVLDGYSGFIVTVAAIPVYLMAFAAIGRRRMAAGLGDDAVLRGQMIAARRFRWVGFALCAVLAVEVGMAFGSERVYMQNIQNYQDAQAQLREVQDFVHGQPDYEDDRAFYDGQVEDAREYADMMRDEAVRDVSDGVVMGGMVGIAVLFLGLWVLSILEIIISRLAFADAPVVPAGGDGSIAAAGSAYDPQALAAPLPDDMLALYKRVCESKAAGVRPLWMAGKSDDRGFYMAGMLQSTGPAHFVEGAVVFCVWIAWAVLSMVAVAFGFAE